MPLFLWLQTGFRCSPEFRAHVTPCERPAKPVVRSVHNIAGGNSGVYLGQGAVDSAHVHVRFVQNEINHATGIQPRRPQGVPRLLCDLQT